MISLLDYETAQKIFKGCYRAPFTTLLRLKRNKGLVARPIRWTEDEIESLSFAMNVAFCKLQNEKAPNDYGDESIYAKLQIVGAVCDEARKLLARRSQRPVILSYEQDLDKNIPAPQWMDDFEEVENQIHLERICEEVQKKSQKLMDALVASSKWENIQFEEFGMGRSTFFRLKKIACEKFLKTT